MMRSLIYKTDKISPLNKLKHYSWLTKKNVVTSRTTLQLPSLKAWGNMEKDATCCCATAHELLSAAPHLREHGSKAPALCWQIWAAQREQESSEIHPLQWTNLISQEAEPWKKAKVDNTWPCCCRPPRNNISWKSCWNRATALETF